MSLIKTILAVLYTIFALVGYLIIGLPAYLLGFLGLKRPMSRVIHWLAHIWGKGIIALSGSSVEVIGKEYIPKSGNVCFVSNHSGVVDILVAVAYINRPFGFIAKKELSYIPLLNIWILILGGLFIDRKNIRKALKTINNGIKRIETGGAMLIFPEGTRSKGRGLLPFHTGSIKLATHSKAIIVPIAISGSYEVFEKNYRVNAVPIRVVFFPPIDTAQMSPEDRRHKLVDQVRDIIASEIT